MEKQQKQKLAVAIIFFTIITGISIWAYVAILKPNKEYHKKTGKKFTQKIQYKTNYNPDYIDSLVEVNKHAPKK